MKKPMNFQETLAKCKEFGFNEDITREVLWNEAYWLGRSRWHWGPHWWVNVCGWVNTQKSKIKSCLTKKNAAEDRS